MELAPWSQIHPWLVIDGSKEAGNQLVPMTTLYVPPWWLPHSSWVSFLRSSITDDTGWCGVGSRFYGEVVRQRYMTTMCGPRCRVGDLPERVVMAGSTGCTLISQCTTGVLPHPAPESNQSATEPGEVASTSHDPDTLRTGFVKTLIGVWSVVLFWKRQRLGGGGRDNDASGWPLANVC